MINIIDLYKQSTPSVKNKNGYYHLTMGTRVSGEVAIIAEGNYLNNRQVGYWIYNDFGPRKTYHIR